MPSVAIGSYCCDLLVRALARRLVVGGISRSLQQDLFVARSEEEEEEETNIKTADPRQSPRSGPKGGYDCRQDQRHVRMPGQRCFCSPPILACVLYFLEKTIREKKKRNVESKDDLCAGGRSKCAGVMSNLAWRLSQVLLQPCTQAETKDAIEPLREMRGRRRIMIWIMDGRADESEADAGGVRSMWYVASRWGRGRLLPSRKHTEGGCFVRRYLAEYTKRLLCRQ